jgi:hypothetical protein
VVSVNERHDLKCVKAALRFLVISLFGADNGGTIHLLLILFLHLTKLRSNQFSPWVLWFLAIKGLLGTVALFCLANATMDTTRNNA